MIVLPLGSSPKSFVQSAHLDRFFVKRVGAKSVRAPSDHGGLVGNSGMGFYWNECINLKYIYIHTLERARWEWTNYYSGSAEQNHRLVLYIILFISLLSVLRCWSSFCTTHNDQLFWTIMELLFVCVCLLGCHGAAREIICLISRCGTWGCLYVCDVD